MDGKWVESAPREPEGGDGLRPKPIKAPRPAQCRTYTRDRVAEALPEIVTRFVKEAKDGSVAHTKLLTSLGGLDKQELPAPRKRRSKSVIALLMERLAELPEENGSEGK